MTPGRVVLIVAAGLAGWLAIGFGVAVIVGKAIHRADRRIR